MLDGGGGAWMEQLTKLIEQRAQPERLHLRARAHPERQRPDVRQIASVGVDAILARDPKMVIGEDGPPHRAALLAAIGRGRVVEVKVLYSMQQAVRVLLRHHVVI